LTSFFPFSPEQLLGTFFNPHDNFRVWKHALLPFFGFREDCFPFSFFSPLRSQGFFVMFVSGPLAGGRPFPPPHACSLFKRVDTVFGDVPFFSDFCSLSLFFTKVSFFAAQTPQIQGFFFFFSCGQVAYFFLCPWVNLIFFFFFR